MDDVTLPPVMQRIVAARQNRRQRRAAMSLPEKIAAIVRLQKMVAPIYRARGQHYHVWDLPPDDPARKFLKPDQEDDKP